MSIREENKQVTRISETRRGQEIQVNWIPNKDTSHEEQITKEPLDESERGKWKNWLKAQHSEN